MSQNEENPVQDLSSRAVDELQQSAERAEAAAVDAAARAGELKEKLGHTIKRAAVKVRENSPHETVKTATDRLAQRLEAAGSYLEEKNFESMLDDVMAFVRCHPVQTALVGVGLGIFLARRIGR